MTVTVKFFAYFRDLFDARERTLELPEGATAGRLLEILCDTRARRKEIFEGAGLRPLVLVIVNGAPLKPSRGLNTVLAGGDVVAVFPFVGGG